MPVIQVNGANVDVEQAGAGRDLVLLHSLLAERSAFDRVVPALVQKHRVSLINLPGYGKSTAFGASIEEYADHVAGECDLHEEQRDGHHVSDPEQPCLE